MSKVLLLIGGNEGDRMDNIKMSKDLIEERIGRITNESGIYESEPWGFEHAQNFLNQVLEVKCTMDAMDILEISQSIEKELGRKAKTTKGYEGRTMDIDILFYEDLVKKSARLTIPHPQLHKRKFTLLPLVEKWENLLHPTLHKTMKELLIECEDEGWVKKFK
ncbi:2-amino-4-hydroxy-6-hydroxymethyldihydropteridine diphosphokinase [Plebeiibacterium sediminum]|uniref:2-amino-4-hydroxy-6-hydroxymethyldihydropteridine pyrophosphokinase n=1 Tax=Plebeiibacterium sediminum TaxID=2992112 RepID=A0AAE3M1P9_9BACT|nr:2-amino-4-hydroxy-6-hydroxymethyldihydropteridine diphosphokinase [Plebeiobacterium sediminum]MCW3785513.1 2-amino-4-hydroxy-6-hydroxymethyldihydropteridine diphosphokinase [Plebeiobacterium sediminum]